MSKEIRSDALDVVALALGLARSSGGASNFDDGELSQVLNVTPLVRRGRTLGSSTGWFYAILENVHPGADDKGTSVDPYNIVSQFLAPWVSPVPKGFDIWIGRVSGLRNAGAGDLTIGTLGLEPRSEQRAFGEDNGGGAVVAIPIQNLAIFTGIDTTGADDILVGPNTEGSFPVNIRWPRGASMIWRTTSSAAAEFQVSMMLGLFPVGMGQDIAF